MIYPSLLVAALESMLPAVPTDDYGAPSRALTGHEWGRLCRLIEDAHAKDLQAARLGDSFSATAHGMELAAEVADRVAREATLPSFLFPGSASEAAGAQRVGEAIRRDRESLARLHPKRPETAPAPEGTKP